MIGHGSTRPQRALAAWATCFALATLATSAGCRTSPLADDWEQLAPTEREALACGALRDAFARDREVVDVSRLRILFRSPAGAARALYLRDIERIEPNTETRGNERNERVEIFVRRGSRSQASSGAEMPLLLGSPSLILEGRPVGTTRQLLASLEYLVGGGAAVELAPDPDPGSAGIVSKPAGETLPAKVSLPAEPIVAAEAIVPAAEGSPSPSPRAQTEGDRLKRIEEELRALKQWHDEGLIDADEYRARKATLLGDRS